MTDFEGLSALVTGGASGIGAATAELLRRRGARVAVADLVVPAGGGGGPSGTEGEVVVRCDVTDRSSVAEAIAAVVGAFGGLDVVVSNAGIGATGDVSANDDAEWARLLDVNVIGMARVVAAALPHLRRSDRASVVLTGSVVATVGVPNRVAYAASKGAVQAMVLAMAADHVGDGIRVNGVSPGTTDTPWVGRLLAAADDPEGAATALRGRQPLGRLVTPAEVAHAIAHLASPLSAATTGTILTVDGGMTGLRLPT
ncbi:SDR family oxidoreductase [soil metagenome]